MLHRYLICFNVPAEPEQTHQLLIGLRGVEIAQGTWIVPSFESLTVVWMKILNTLPENVDAFAIPLLPQVSIVPIRGTGALVEKLKGLGYRPHSEE
jgi:hypothetical protein